MASQFDEFVARKRREYGDRFDDSHLYPQFRSWFNAGVRVEVSGEYFANRKRRGRIGVTTGWRPSFLLMYRTSDSGSGDILGADDHVIARQSGRDYVPVSSGGGAYRRRTARHHPNPAVARRARGR